MTTELIQERSHEDADQGQQANGLWLAEELRQFIEHDVLPGTGIEPAELWRGMGEIFRQFTPKNWALLAERDRLQGQIDIWHRTLAQSKNAPKVGAPVDFLHEIGYLQPEPEPFSIGTDGTDPEVGQMAGPQLVVPVLNARFALNAANARWGSLYDAYYGTDALGLGAAQGGGYDRARGEQVIAAAKAFLDIAAPLADGQWSEWTGGTPKLVDPAQLVGRSGSNLLLRNNGLHIEIIIDADHQIGKSDPAHIADVVLESALSTIIDLEDSVAAVDASDKTAAYRNWLGLMRGDLSATFKKGGQDVQRTMEPDRKYTAEDGSAFTLKGRSLLMVRNVGHLMTNPAAQFDGEDVFEGILDAIVTSLIALHDRSGSGERRNSQTGAVYIVKPKMHGPEECRFTNALFDAVEDLLKLPQHTIKVGVMDEERRTSANLAACIYAVRNRVFFINTGFLDRTGDEIHTSMLAGAFLRKAAIKTAPWMQAYEDRNVQIGLACGFAGKAQIGKGMWAAPDRMQAMLAEKIGHPQSGASTAWVPSPTAATLHATHYHMCNVQERQQARTGEKVAPLETLLTVPLAARTDWSDEEVKEELENNAQGILGYVVRWIDQGVGCSKVPDIHDIGLMEDRATLRISSQHIANWLLHGIVTPEMVDDALRRMAAKVDAQNAGDPAYQPMSGIEAASRAFQAARGLIWNGVDEPNGYTEPALHHIRLQEKQAQG